MQINHLANIFDLSFEIKLIMAITLKYGNLYYHLDQTTNSCTEEFTSLSPPVI